MIVYKAIKNNERIYVNPDKMEEFVSIGFKIYEETNNGDVEVISIPNENVISVKIL